MASFYTFGRDGQRADQSQRSCPEQEPPACKPATPDAEFLRAAMDNCCADLRLYEALACCCLRSCVGQTCERLACQKRQQLRQLQTAYFIETGDRAFPKATCPYIASPMESLRQQCREERAASAVFLDYAETTVCTRLASLFSCMATEHTQTACTVEQLISGLLCT